MLLPKNNEATAIRCKELLVWKRKSPNGIMEEAQKCVPPHSGKGRLKFLADLESGNSLTVNTCNNEMQNQQGPCDSCSLSAMPRWG